MSREMTNSSGFPQLSKTTSDLSIYWGNELYTSHEQIQDLSDRDIPTPPLQTKSSHS